MADTLTDTVWLDETAITRLLGNQTALQEFPFLKTYVKLATKKGCGCGKGNRNKSVDYRTIKRLLAEMAGDKKATLKQLLNARQVKVRYESNGSAVERTF